MVRIQLVTSVNGQITGNAVERNVAVDVINELYSIDMTDTDSATFTAYNGQTWEINFLAA